MNHKEMNITQDIHLGALNKKGVHGKVLKEVSKKLLKSIENMPSIYPRPNMPHVYCGCVGDQINFKEDNKMYKNNLDLLTEKRESVDFVLGITKFTERGFVVRLTLDTKSKKEFVEYGEDVGEYINDLIHDFIEDIEDEQMKEEQIEYLEEKMERDQERLAELKGDK